MGGEGSESAVRTRVVVENSRLTQCAGHGRNWEICRRAEDRASNAAARRRQSCGASSKTLNLRASSGSMRRSHYFLLIA